jgi:hypothetical protein
MGTPMSLPVWLLLVAVIAAPMHFSVGKLHLRGWLHYVTTSILTLTITAFIGFIATGPWGAVYRDLRISSFLGVVFGGPVGLILAMIVTPARGKSFPACQ